MECGCICMFDFSSAGEWDVLVILEKILSWWTMDMMDVTAILMPFSCHVLNVPLDQIHQCVGVSACVCVWTGFISVYATAWYWEALSSQCTDAWLTGPYFIITLVQSLVQPGGFIMKMLMCCWNRLLGLPLLPALISNPTQEVLSTTPLLRSLYWFPVDACIRFKTLMLAY